MSFAGGRLRLGGASLATSTPGKQHSCHASRQRFAPRRRGPAAFGRPRFASCLFRFAPFSGVAGSVVLGKETKEQTLPANAEKAILGVGD